MDSTRINYKDYIIEILTNYNIMFVNALEEYITINLK